MNRTLHYLQSLAFSRPVLPHCLFLKLFPAVSFRLCWRNHLIQTAWKIIDRYLWQRQCQSFQNVCLSELTESFFPSDLQFGFLENRGKTQASLLVTETVQWHLNRDSPVFAANLDARKCFDRIWHDGLFFRLISLLNPRSWHLLVAW